jgi:hypothetical protein
MVPVKLPPLPPRALRGSACAPKAISPLAQTIASGATSCLPAPIPSSTTFGAIKVSRVFEDELVFVIRLIRHIMEAVAAIDSWTRARLTPSVHSGAAREQSHYELTRGRPALDIVRTDVSAPRPRSRWPRHHAIMLLYGFVRFLKANLPMISG